RREESQDHRPDDADGVEMGQRLIAALGFRDDIGSSCSGHRVQRVHTPQAESAYAQAEQRAGAGQDADLDQMLKEDLATARAERASYAGDRGAAEELREQNPDRVEQAHGQE